jgi:DNA-binding PadR family transcriptional regulator
LSRSVLLSLVDGPATVDDILARLGPHNDTVNNGTVWTIVERARLQGLVTCGVKSEQKPPYRYSLTDGGLRRVAWIKSQFKRKLKPAELKVVANPVEKEEE